MHCFDLRNIMVLVCLGEALTWGAYSGGNGSLDDPYQLATEADWRYLAASPDHWDACFVALNDVDFEEGVMPLIGTALIPFSGELDGQGMSLNQLVSDGRLDPSIADVATPPNNLRRAGLFGMLTGTVMDLVLIDPLITSTNSGNAGALAADVEGGQITDCHVQGGKVLGRNAGALVGWAQDAVIEVCSTEQVFVTGQLNTGGLIGNMQGGTVLQCKANDWLVAEAGHAGGLVGLVNGSYLAYCYSEGVLVCSNSTVVLGGVVGYLGGTLQYCYGNNSFYVWTLPYSGGLAGRTTSGAALWNCIWNQDKAANWPAVGGSSQIEAEATTEQLMSQDFMAQAGWDLTHEIDNGRDDIWVVDDGVDVPRLRWEVNTAPVAYAGPDQAVKTSGTMAQVVLNGTGSYDYDGDVQQWQWTWMVGDVEYQADGARPLLSLPLGLHTIELRVSDGQLWSTPDSVTVLVTD